MTLKETQGLVKHGEVYAQQPLYNDEGVVYNDAVDYRNISATPRSGDSNNRYEYIKNGKRDNAPLILLDLYKKSSKHQSSINLIASLVGGEVIYNPVEEICRRNRFGDLEYLPTALTDANGDEIIEQARRFGKGIMVDRYKDKACQQMALFGGYYGFGDTINNTVMETDEKGVKRLTSRLRRIWVEDYENCRLSCDRVFLDGEWISERHLVSDNFRHLNHTNPVSYSELKTKSTFNNIHRFASVKADMNEPTKFLPPNLRSKFVGRVTSYRNYYATPVYEALDLLNYVNTDYLVSEYDKNGIATGFSLDFIVVKYRNQLGDEAAEKTKRKKEVEEFQKSASGVQGKNVMFCWAEPSVDNNGQFVYPKPYDIIKIPHNTDDARFTGLKEETESRILSAHKIISPELIALNKQNGSGFSSQAEHLIAAQEMVYFHYKNEYQNLIAKDLTDRFQLSDIPVEITFGKNINSFRQLSETVMTEIATIPELRQIFGLPSDYDENELIKAVIDRIKKRENGVQQL